MLIDDIKDYLKENKNTILLCLLTTFIIGLICHGYLYFNQFYSHDSIGVYADKGEGLWQLSLGRFLVDIQMDIRGRYSSGVMIGFLSLLFLAIGTYIILKLLDIKNRSLQVIATSILVTYSSLTLSNASYIFLSDIYMLAFLCAAISTYLIRKDNILKYLAIITIAITCGLYQSYLFVMIGLLCFLSIKDLLDGKEFKDVIKNIFKYALIGTLGLALYYLLLVLFRNINNIDMHMAENSISQIGQISLSSIPSLIKNTYSYFLSRFIRPNVYHPSFIRIVIFIIFIISFYYAFNMIKKLRGKELCLLIVLAILLPLSLNGIYILVSGTVHDLMTYQFSLVYLMAIYFIEHGKEIKYNNILKIITQALLILIVFDSIVYANQVYLKKDLEYRKTREITNRIIYHIEDLEEYKHEETPIAFIGCLSDSSLFTPYEDMNYDAVGLLESSALTYFKTYDKYFNDQLNYNLNLLSEEECRELENTNEVKQMDYYPNKNSIKYINGIVVVKIADFK